MNGDIAMKKITKDAYTKANNELNRLRSEVDTINKQIETLESARDKLKKKLESVDRITKTYKLLDSINDVTLENATFVMLASNTRTTPIMDKFNHSKDTFLRIGNAVWMNSIFGELIVTNMDYDVEYVRSSITMTDLKKNMPLSPYRYNKETSSRLKELLEELKILESNHPQRGAFLSVHKTNPSRRSNLQQPNRLRFSL